MSLGKRICITASDDSLYWNNGTGIMFSLRKKTSESLWTELAGMPGLLIAVTDLGFRLKWANDFFYEYFKCRPDDVLGKAMHSFLGEDVRGDMGEAHIRRIHEEGHVWDHHARTTSPDGDFITIRWNQRATSDMILSVGFPPADEKPVEVPKPTVLEHSEIAGQIPDIYNLTSSTPEVDLALSRYISTKNFVMHYQPRVNARTKAISGAEGLVRLKHPDRGLLYPSDFLPTAEKTGHILELGTYVLDAVCRKLKQWQNGLTLSIAINVSPKQLQDDGLVEELLSSAAKYGIENSRLMFELSERTVAIHFDEAMRAMKLLKDAGFMVAIDDYCMGFLPLNALTKLAVDNITIDQRYIAQADTDPTVFPIMESIIMLAHSLNMTVTAGGVENRRQLEFLLDNSVDFLQGYLISEPLPETEFDRFLETDMDFYTRHL